MRLSPVDTKVAADTLKLQCACGLWRFVDHPKLDVCNVGLIERSSMCCAALFSASKQLFILGYVSCDTLLTSGLDH